MLISWNHLGKDHACAYSHILWHYIVFSGFTNREVHKIAQNHEWGAGVFSITHCCIFRSNHILFMLFKIKRKSFCWQLIAPLRFCKSFYWLSIEVVCVPVNSVCLRKGQNWLETTVGTKWKSPQVCYGLGPLHAALFVNQEHKCRVKGMHLPAHLICPWAFHTNGLQCEAATAV